MISPTAFFTGILTMVSALLIVFTLALSHPHPAWAEASAYELSLSFELGQESGHLHGKAKLTIPPGQRLTLAFAGMQVTSALLREANGLENQLAEMHDALILPASTSTRTLVLSYSKTVTGEEDNLITSQGISLNSNWHPVPDQPMHFHLTASLPDTFSAITESETFPLARRGQVVHADYQTLTTAIHFAAGPYTIHKRQVRENLFVHTMFFPEDASLAEGYLQAATEYLNRYERLIGPYPYKHYVIVANRLPTGFGLPTFTLLGQQVLRLPFIKDTSLGHEIVHSWLGNAVEVDYSGGNWCEGLTAYLADHAYRADKGEGAADRKESITRYLNYVGNNSPFTLHSFSSPSHSQAMAEVKRSVGYDRGAMLFHELHEKIGPSAFGEALRHFYTKNRGSKASWLDLQQSFSQAAKIDLATFFTERLTRTDIPNLVIDDVRVTSTGKHSELTFTLQQKTAKPYTLLLPIRIRTEGGEITVTKEIEDLATQLTIYLDQRPLEFIIDPNHDILRQLSPEESPAVWSQFLGADKKLAILAKEDDRKQYQPLLNSLQGQDVSITTADKVSNLDLRNNNLIFLGADQAPARSLFGPPTPSTHDLTVDVRKNPLSPQFVAVLVTSQDPDAARGIIGRLNHYGKYSFLSFDKGRNIEKRIQSTQSGLHFLLEDLPRGGATEAVMDFADIINQINKARVVYLGESHTSFADHLLQLRIIESLYKKDPHLAIGMEMFPVTAQPVLDRYILGDGGMDEKSFLKESKYFQVWKYDYRFYRDILNFAKTRKIPVIGLNIEQQIVTEVFHSGGTDNLSPETLASLPMDRDLAMAGYAERLMQVHEMHVQGNHASGFSSGFLQAQALWDESMAQHIAGFLAARPELRMVVLAGTQHTRKDSGIPPRVARRLPGLQASVINLYNDSQPADLKNLADYFFLATDQNLPEIPKIGIVLTTETSDNHFFLKISEISPHGKAGAAGLLAGDILKKINGISVNDMADLQIVMLDQQKGATIPVKILRQTPEGERELEFQVELTTAPGSHPAP